MRVRVRVRVCVPRDGWNCSRRTLVPVYSLKWIWNWPRSRLGVMEMLNRGGTGVVGKSASTGPACGLEASVAGGVRDPPVAVPPPPRAGGNGVAGLSDGVVEEEGRCEGGGDSGGEEPNPATVDMLLVLVEWDSVAPAGRPPLTPRSMSAPGAGTPTSSAGSGRCRTQPSR